MEIITGLIDFILHIDTHLAQIVQTYGTLTYLILFLIVFCETGLVVTPFLPGDSLLFVIGALGASGALDVKLVTILLIAAAILGDTVNYHIGKFIGHKAYRLKDSRFFKKAYLEKTHNFYERHGGKTIIISRFIPIIRTFAPFVAGMGNMTYLKFISYNIIGGIVWVLLFIAGGYLFGNMPVVKSNFTLVIFAIIFISLLPGIMTFLRSKIQARKSIKA
ncbi:MAG TPA: DedA family protein [Pseudobacteroides sp.]|uniref:DedA family protein n=1 Tax=Pseudobacteroides sp. TaxID=1968840 RepID=UPI002F940154